MTFAKRLRLYLVGVGIGIFVVLIFFGPRAVSCSYFPNDRVFAEAKSYDLELSEEVKIWAKQNNKEVSFFKDSLFGNSKILNFGTEEARQEPCSQYLAENQSLKLNFTFEVCAKGSKKTKLTEIKEN